MSAIGCSEHGSVFEWYHKKCAAEAAGMKYLHAIETYVTETLEEKIRDNYHCVLIAKNYDGFLELNQLISNSFNRQDNHFYYVPRISLDELFGISENIILTTACIGGILGKGTNSVKEKFLHYIYKHKTTNRFLEIGHHNCQAQAEYNAKMWELSKQTGIPLIAGTDTHILNETHEKGRKILQAAKKIFFESEDEWDLKFKTYDELVEAYKTQGALPGEAYMQAIQNTNVLADSIEEYEIDRSIKYPKIYNDGQKIFYQKAVEAIENHPHALKNHSREELQKVVDEEFEVYKATQSIDFMLLQTYLREWEETQDIRRGYGRGSVSGSMIAYLLGITQMDSPRFGLSFFRFQNPSRVTLSDIDCDYSDEDREKVKAFLLKDKMNLPSIRSAEIITFNTIALKGAIRDVCRALYKDSDKVDYMKLSNEICKAADIDEELLYKKYPQVMEYADIVNGTIVSIGSHPSGVLISDKEISQTVGLCSLAGSDYPVSMLNMKELDDLMYVKHDCLGLSNIGAINETCKFIGIPRLNPDNTDLEDPAVWDSIRKNTMLIFQWESASAQKFLKKFMSDETLAKVRDKIPNFSMLKWLSFGNGLIRPACAAFRDSAANGEFYDNGFDELNTFLAPETGRIAMQETIMQFLVKFCGYTDAESDNVRRAIAKKKGTETLLPEIEKRFIEYCPKHYDISAEKCAQVIKPFIRTILDASDYAFSWNHSDAYSAIGYICGYLRHYYPLEFLTAALNIFGDKTEKTAAITNYASQIGIQVTMPKWGLSKRDYFYNKEKRVIAKGLASIRYMGGKIADELYELASSNTYPTFVQLLKDLDEKTSLDSRQLDILIKLDFFSDFGNQRELLRIVSLFNEPFKKGDAKQIKRSAVEGTPLDPIINKYSIGRTKSGGIAKSYVVTDIMAILKEVEAQVKESNMPDLDDLTKVKNFYDIMGYVGYISGKDEDRRKLYITQTKPLYRKKDGKHFGYSVFTKSIGSGKEARFTLFNEVYNKDPVKEGDIIKCTNYKTDGGYFTLTAYQKIF